jgi:iron-sulfur cluster repair protein YtfE (RIC family)
MTTVTQPLRDEHRELRPDIEALQSLADVVGTAPADAITRQLDTALAFLTQHLLVHAQAEEQVLYPAVAEALGAPAATATMRRDHVAIRQMTTDLLKARQQLDQTRLTTNDEQTLRRLLYGLHTLVQVHLAKEEEVFLPALDAALTADKARDLFTTMEQAAAAVRATAAER